ncbi:hypothetical protein BS17DRAFT_425641 [Gyrodon lividus]|nr:hypothetical protein BS17DRAFT_425641 [Gyrodon lividus]
MRLTSKIVESCVGRLDLCQRCTAIRISNESKDESLRGLFKLVASGIPQHRSVPRLVPSRDLAGHISREAYLVGSNSQEPFRSNSAGPAVDRASTHRPRTPPSSNTWYRSQFLKVEISSRSPFSVFRGGWADCKAYIDKSSISCIFSTRRRYLVKSER